MRKDSSLQSKMPEGHKASEASGAGAVVVIRSAYDRSRVRVGLSCLESEDRTQQAFRDECDINVLMKRYEKTGILPVGRDLPPQYADVSSLDFESSMQRVAEVQGVFSMLDARTRARFENDPAVMLDFLADPANRDEAVKLGLMPPIEPVAAVAAVSSSSSPEPAEPAAAAVGAPGTSQAPGIGTT